MKICKASGRVQLSCASTAYKTRTKAQQEPAFLPVNTSVSTTAVNNAEIMRSQQTPDAVCVYSQGLDASLLAQVPQPDGLVRRA